MATIDITIYNDDGEETIETLPAKMEVCSECEGEGFVLRGGLRGYAFSAEEFNETFDDDEDRGAYFTRGGKYDEVCPCCKGKNVVPVVDEKELSAAQKEIFETFQEQESDRAAMREADRRTMMMECGGYDY